MRLNKYAVDLLASIRSRSILMQACNVRGSTRDQLLLVPVLHKRAAFYRYIDVHEASLTHPLYLFLLSTVYWRRVQLVLIGVESLSIFPSLGKTFLFQVFASARPLIKFHRNVELFFLQRAISVRSGVDIASTHRLATAIN